MASTFNIEEILACLKNTYLSPDKNVRTQAEKKLAELKELNILTFSSNLMDLLKMPLNEIDQSLRMSIILLLKRSINEKIQKKLLDENTNNQLIQLYIMIIVNPNMSAKEVDNLKETFKELLNNTTSEILVQIVVYISKQITSMPLGSANGVISILSSIIESSTINNGKTFLSILDGTINMTSSILENLYDKYEKLEPDNNLEDYFKLNNIFSSIFYLFFQCGVKGDKKYNIKDEKIANIYENMSIIGIKLLVNLKTNDNNRIISWVGNKKVDKNINSMKVNIFRFLNFHINKTLDDIHIDKKKLETQNQFIKIIMANLEWVIMNKFTYIIKMESTEDYPDYHYSLIISYMLIHLRRTLTKDNFIYEYTKHFNSMYKNILLPLLLITDIEEEILKDNDSVNGYIIDINDIIYENKEKKIKSTLAQLMKKYHNINLNSNTFMIKYTVGLLDYLVNNNNLEDKTLFNENDIIILLLKAYSKDKIITVLFLALNILSQVEKCPNKVENDNLLNKFYKTSFDTLTNNLNYPPLKHQFILFIRNYALRFDEADSISFGTGIKFIYSYLFEIQYSLISNTAADTIQYFFNDNNEEDEKAIKNTLLKVATNMASNFEKFILEVNISNFFEVLYQIMTNFEDRNNDFNRKIYENLCKRVNVEVERHLRLKFITKKENNKIKKKATEKTNFNDYKIIINKCFNIIKYIINNKRFVDKNYELIENSLKPLVAFMEDPTKIDFDEDLIYIIYILIKQREKVTGIGFGLIKYLSKYIEKVGGLLLDAYQLINLYLAYGTEQILANKIWCEGLFSALKSGINADGFNKSGLYTCILIQTWVIHCNKIPNKDLKILIDKILNKLSIILINNNKKKYMSEEKYNFLGYVTLLLSGLINYSSVIIPSLQKVKYENDFKKWLIIIAEENEVIFEYEIKIIIYSTCIIIKNGIINGDINDLLNACIALLKCQEGNGKYELRKRTKKELDYAFVEDDDEDNSKNDDDYEEDEDYIEFKEIKELVKNTINPIKDMDEFKIFNDFLVYLKNNRNDIYSSWENTLDEEAKNNITKLFSVKRIHIKYGKNNSNSVLVPRRIVSIKRNINNK